MAEWTGILYGFYSNKPINEVFSLLKKEMGKINYQSNYYSAMDETSLFFFKDKNMFEHHLNNGYNIDMDGMGCFSVEAKNADLHGLATLFEYEDKSDFEPYDINLNFNNIFYYVLVLPEIVESSKFCLTLYNEFKKILNA